MFATCISKVRDAALKVRLAAAQSSVVAASAQFDAAAATGALHSVSRDPVVPPDVTTDEMERVYTQRMAKNGSPGRQIYDDISNAAPQGRCPLCAHRLVSTLDHQLPKSFYPALAVAPLNLVPACGDCNKAKLALVPRAPEEVTLHPYYDDLGSGRWLIADVVQTDPAALRFGVRPPAHWNTVLAARVRNHFRVLGLRRLYGAEAAEELTNIRIDLSKFFHAGGEVGVRGELARRAASCAAARPNGWRTAAYEAWTADAWFCRGGFGVLDP